MSSAYCSEPCSHARCKTRSVRDEQEAEHARNLVRNHAASVARITLDVLHPMAPETRKIVLDELRRVFCASCSRVRDPEDGSCECDPKPRRCENCGELDPNNDHWDDLDGPNRAGWACPRVRTSMADEIKAMKKKLRK